MATIAALAGAGLRAGRPYDRVAGALVCVDDYITTERVAVVVRALTLGDKLTTADVARLVGITPAGARMMLGKISRVTPLCQDERGRWVMYLDGAEI